MDLPLKNKGGEGFPGNGCCLQCGQAGVTEPREFVCFTGGSLGREENYGKPTQPIEAFLHLVWHGAHPISPNDPTPDSGWASIRILEDLPGGQFQLFFCSLNCFRKFFSLLADRLEKEIPKRS